MYVIRCMNPKEYTYLKKYLDNTPEIKVKLFNSYHKEFLNELNELISINQIKIEYPRHLAEEVGWMVGKVKKGHLRNLSLELLIPNYTSLGVNEVLVIGEGYDE